MRDITLEELLEAGCHFGHQVNRRNPKANEFIFEARQSVHIIDLGKTREGLLAAAEFVKSLASKNGNLVIVGTKRQAKPIVEEEVKRALEAHATGLYYTTARWIGGILTNFPEVSKNFKKIEEINGFLAFGNPQGYTKRELLLFERERQKLMTLYGGIAKIDRVPDALFIIDTHLERTAVKEATNVGITTVGVVDTNADPYEVTYPIPANDDAVGSIKLITSYIVDAWIEGKKEASKAAEIQRAKESKETKAEDQEEKKAETTSTIKKSAQ